MASGMSRSSDPPAPPPDVDSQVRAVLRRSIAPFDASGTADEWRRRASALRQRALREIFLKGVDPAVVSAAPRVEWGDVIEPESRYRIRKLRYETLPDYWIPALLYEPIGTVLGKRAAVLNADGHHDAGNAASYKQIRCVNLALRGVVALSFEFVGMGELGGDSDYDRDVGASLHSNLGAHELVGIGAPAVMYVAMHHALRIVIDHPDVDPERVVMTGLSGGGWQTIVLAAMDERVAGAVPVAGYTAIRSRIECDDDVGDLEQIPADMTTVLDYQDMTAMLAPRPTLLVLNEHDDCCFRTDRAKPVIYDAVRPVFEAFGAGDAFACHSSQDPGDHNYGPDNRRELYRFLARHFQVEGPDSDCHRDSDVLAEHALRVGLPHTQLAMAEIARRRGRELHRHRNRRSPDDPAATRRQLREVLRVPDDVVDDVGVFRRGAANETFVVTIGPWSVTVQWCIDALEAVREVQLDVSDDGAAVTAAPGPATARCGVDLLGTGSSVVSPGLTAMLSAAGHRLLGIQVAQVLALAEALSEIGVPLRVAGDGPVTSVATLFAAALRPELFERAIVTRSPFASLEDLIGKGVRYCEAAPLFCPDLLTVTDLAEVMPLLAGVAWSDERSGTSDPK